MSDNLSAFASTGEAEDPSDNYDDGDSKLTPEELKKLKHKSNQWTTTARGMYQACSATSKIIPPGVYKYVNTGMGFAFEEQAINIDELLMMPNSHCSKIMDEIEVFLNSKTDFEKYKVLHRRGYLFYGPPGSGKTSLVHQIFAGVIRKGGVVLICNNPSSLEKGLAEIRSVEPHRFIVCLFEDIDALIGNYGEREILAVLDGESQINKVLNIATTNYPEKLDKRIVSRPRRFDRVIEIGFPNAALRAHYFKHKMQIPEHELVQWVKHTENFSFGACTDLLISVKCLKNDFGASVKILKTMMETYTKKAKK